MIENGALEMKRNNIGLWLLSGLFITLSIILVMCVPVQALAEFPRLDYIETIINEDGEIGNLYYVNCGDYYYVVMTIEINYIDKPVEHIYLLESCGLKLYLPGAIESVEVVAVIPQAPEPVTLRYMYLPLVSK